MQRIEIDHAFAKPVERVFAYLAERENLGPLFGAKVTRVRDGDTEQTRFTPQGTGSHLRYVIEFGAVVPGLERVSGSAWSAASAPRCRGSTSGPDVIVAAGLLDTRCAAKAAPA